MKYLTKRVLAVVGLGAVIAAGAVTANAAISSSGTVSGTTYNALTSYRLLDTRTASALPADTPMQVTVGGKDGVPADATAVTLNLTVTGSKSSGYVLAWPDGAAQPSKGSNVNFAAGQTVANQATVPMADGKIDVEFFGAGSTQLVVDLEGYFTTPTVTVTSAYTPTSATATSSVLDHPDSGDNGQNWAVDTLTRTASVTLKGVASVSDCGSGATTCYLYEGAIADTGSFTTASSASVATDGLSPHASTAINGTETGSVTGGSAVEFYASSNAPTAGAVPAVVSGAVSGEKTTTDWVEQFFPAGTTFGTGPSLLNWDWTYSTSNTCETWVDALSGETGDITGTNACAS